MTWLRAVLRLKRNGQNRNQQQRRVLGKQQRRMEGVWLHCAAVWKRVRWGGGGRRRQMERW